MNNKAVIIEQTLKASVDKVWKAITDAGEMEHWYFEIDDFKPEPGFTFQFYSGGEETKYLHICKVLVVEPKRKLSYSWRYEDLDGNSIVTFELSEQGKNTHIRFTHEGIESFPQDKPDFSRESFLGGWKEIIGISLKEYLENK